MTWPNRFRFFVGLIVVVVFVGACTVVLTQRQSRAHSTSASIQADEYSVGVTYGGTVVAQHVEPGDTVSAGDALFDIQSLQLAKDLDEEVLEPSDLVNTDAETGTYTVVATVDGSVTEVVTPVGDFAPAGTVVAKIARAGSLNVAAEFLLAARDYGRIEEGTPVDLTLPNDTQIRGVVEDIEVETVAGQAKSTVTISSETLAAAPFGGLVKAGTPVLVTMQLRDDGLLAGVTDSFRDFVRQVGL